MKFNINRKEKWSAGLLLLIGMATVIGSTNYKIGTLARMGPGYFPLLLGAILMILGLLIALTPDSSPHEVEETSAADMVKSRLKTWFLVIVSVLSFIVLGKYGGLVIATFVMTFLAALADKSNSVKTCLVVGMVLTVMTVVVFHYGLQMQFPLFTWG